MLHHHADGEFIAVRGIRIREPVRTTPRIERDRHPVEARVGIGCAVVAGRDSGRVVPHDDLGDILGSEAVRQKVRAQVDNGEAVNDQQHQRLDVRLVQGLIDLQGVRVLDVREAGDDILRDIEALQDSLKDAVGTLRESRVERALELELLDRIAEFRRTANDERHDGARGLLVADRRRHRVDQLLLELVLGLLDGEGDGVDLGVVVEREVPVALRGNAEAVRKVERTGIEAAACGGAECTVEEEEFCAHVEKAAQA